MPSGCIKSPKNHLVGWQSVQTLLRARFPAPLWRTVRQTHPLSCPGSEIPPWGGWFLKAEGTPQPSEIMFVIQSRLSLGQDQLCLEMPAPCHIEIVLMVNDCQLFRSRTSPTPMPLLHEERQVFPTPAPKTSGFFLLFFIWDFAGFKMPCPSALGTCLQSSLCLNAFSILCDSVWLSTQLPMQTSLWKKKDLEAGNTKDLYRSKAQR